MPVEKQQKGFSIIEAVVGIAVFVLFAIGIYSGIQYIFKVVYQSRLRIIETAVLNEQVELMRNLSFYDVGIVSSSPAGPLERTVNITRNGIDFTITRTIRNIDDPFDGLATSTDPIDTSPADYKMVQIEIICDSCSQQEPVSVTTYIAPRNLEGDPDHGSLYVEVFDADANPVQGAEVHILATTTDPVYDFIDTTDNDGMLKVYDLASGTRAYHITVTKDGFTTDQTLVASVENPNPVKPPVSILPQDLTEISFSIDEVSSINVSTLNNICQVVPSASLGVAGTKLLGTEPDILKVDENFSTSATGTYLFSNLEWDSYSFSANGNDIIGAIPILPLFLTPGVDQSLSIILGTNTGHSLLVHVQDNINSQPISGAVINLTASGYDETKTTGVGHISQTDWSGGDSQLMMTDVSRYWVDDGNADVFGSPGDIKLNLFGMDYVSSTVLESSIFDLGVAGDLVNLSWEPFSQPVETGSSSVRFQIASSSTSTPVSWEYMGPDGTASTYYDETDFTISEDHDGNQYLRYKVFLSTASTTFSPTLSQVSISYVTSCTPPGQSYFGSLSNQEYNLEISAPGYEVYNTVVNVDQDTFVTANLISS